jgi:hypothetical protein
MPVSKKPRGKVTSMPPRSKAKTPVAGDALPDLRAMETYLGAGSGYV